MRLMTIRRMIRRKTSAGRSTVSPAGPARLYRAKAEGRDRIQLSTALRRDSRYGQIVRRQAA